jgi:hypothetical protein
MLLAPDGRGWCGRGLGGVRLSACRNGVHHGDDLKMFRLGDLVGLLVVLTYTTFSYLLHYATICYTTLPYTAQHYTTLQHTAVHCCAMLLYTILHSIALHYAT